MSEMKQASIETKQQNTLNQPTTLLHVNIRTRDGTKDQIPVKGATCLSDVKMETIKQLQPRWDDKGVTLTEDTILVFGVCGDTVTKLEAGDDLWPSEREREGKVFEEEKKKDYSSNFFAYEIFTTVPEDLFRTVKLSQLSPALFAHPEHAKTPWTSVSPLFCAAYLPNEMRTPWYVAKHGDVKINGVSLTTWNGDEEDQVDGSVNPFAKPGLPVKKGITAMAPETYEELIGKEKLEPIVGILKSSVSHERVGNMMLEKKDKIEIPYTSNEKQDLKDKGLATRRNSYFRFKLKKGLDLAKFGVALVYDHSTPGHVSLVRTKEGRKSRSWATVDPEELWLPRDCTEEYLKVKDNNDMLETFLKEEVFHLDGKTMEPELIHGFGTGLVYLPIVASLFSFHDFKMEATAEPGPPPQDDFENTKERHQLYEAALVLHRLDLGWDVEKAIEALETADFVVEELDLPFCETLQEALDSEAILDFKCSEIPEFAADAIGMDFRQAEDALDALREVLRDRISEEQAEQTIASTI